jgi:hypothetical protein
MPKGNYKVEIKNNPDNIWYCLFEYQSILSGKPAEIQAVNEIFLDPAKSRTFSYLSLFASNCRSLIDFDSTIQNATIGIFGCGGIGSNLAILLAGIGFKHFILTDHDTVEKSNFNRQFLFDKHDIGKHKVNVIHKKLQDRYDQLSIEKIRKKSSKELFDSYFPQCDLAVVTADDPLHILYTAIDAARIARKPLLSAAYIKKESRLVFLHPEQRTKKTYTHQFDWFRSPNSIAPSFGPSNLELASTAAFIITFQICNIQPNKRTEFVSERGPKAEVHRHHAGVNATWETDVFPRRYNTINL